MNSVTRFELGHVGLPVAVAAVDAKFDTSRIDSSGRVRDMRGESIYWDEPSLNEVGTAEPS
jgi:UDP-N-acetyl-D-mannosaminuronate dehydrogenase